ncbi:MAG TPA: von Willebrand factor type A domain-containing protein [Thermoanaerobaculia bacterium]|nr:von Willebrand factor type A domain-containing protein [Thermoanaerobaculia bacterium]
MRKTIGTLVIILVSFSLTLHTACSTARGESELAGTVTDGVAPLAGVTITLTSPSLDRPRVAATDARGSFRFNELLPGSYEVAFRAEGFHAVSYGVQVGTTPEHLEAALPRMTEQERLVAETRATTPTDSAADSARVRKERDRRGLIPGLRDLVVANAPAMTTRAAPSPFLREQLNTEEYASIAEGSFLSAADKPLSTFSIDVDRASYSNVRRFLRDAQLPPADSVRIEEMINYFNYAYPPPADGRPFAVHTEIASCPWNESNRLLRIGIQGRQIDSWKMPPSNLVFLLDVSGSMSSPDKLPLVKDAFRLLVDQLRPQDRVSIVVYAGAAGTVLPSTSGADKQRILDAISELEAGGSTAGGEGILLAYRIARENFIPEGSNRVILATDGDFNVGASSAGELEELIVQKRREGVFLTVLGFGTGNLKDAKMELLADKGNGNYAYIDNKLEAEKVFVHELGGTLLTIASDVKIQMDFNPALVEEYRLVGYENRRLQDRDFHDDTKDAGELGAGHSVTALYEIKPVKKSGASSTAQIATLRLRYKDPGAETSQLIATPVRDRGLNWYGASDDFKFAAAVAQFGMLLRNSTHRGNSDWSGALQLAKVARGADPGGYRQELVEMVETAASLQSGTRQIVSGQ